MKKLISLGLATTLALGMAVPTFALGGSGGGTTTPTPTPPVQSTTPTQNPTQSQAPSGGGSTTPSEAPEGGLKDNKLTSNLSGVTVPQSAKIDLTLPSNLNGTLVLNPYGLFYTDGSDAGEQDRVITSGYKYIQNNSTSALNVVWEVTGQASEGVTFVSKNPHEWTKTQATAKSVYLPVMIGQTSDTNTAPAAADKKNDPTAATPAPVYVSAETQTNAQTSSTAKKLTIAATKYLGYGIATAANDSDDAEWWDPDGKGAWVSNGEYPKSTTTAPTNPISHASDPHILKADMESPWTANDTVNVSFVFSFSIA